MAAGLPEESEEGREVAGRGLGTLTATLWDDDMACFTCRRNTHINLTHNNDIRSIFLYNYTVNKNVTHNRYLTGFAV